MARTIIGYGPTGYPIYGDDPDRLWVPPPDPTPAPIAPAPSAPPPLPPAPTPIDPKELAATLYDKAIPVALSDRVQVGGRIIEGPVERIIDNETTVSFIIGYYIPINYWDNTRTVTKLWFRGKEAWNSTQGALLSGLNVGGATSGTEQRVRFTTGTLDQVADAWSISRYGASNAVGYIPLVTGTFENIRTAQFGNEYPFTSVTVEDTAFGTPGDGVVWADALDAVARYDGRPSGEFESINVTGRILALIFGSSPFYFPDFLSGMRKIKPHWNIRTADKLYIVEKGALDLNLTLDLAKIKESGEAAIVFHDADAFDKQREMVANFIDGERDYEPNSVRWTEDIEPVVSTDSFATDSFNLPVVSTTSEVLADLTFAYYNGEMARATAEFTGMAHYLGIEPGDTLKITTPELDHFQRANEVTRKVDFTVEVKTEGILVCTIVPPEPEPPEDVTTWNPSDKSANQILSNNGLTAKANSLSDGAVRSVASKSAGKFYVEMTWSAGTALGADNGWGVTTGSTNLSTVGATTVGAFLVYAGLLGNIWYNGSNAGKHVGGGAIGSVDSIALDFDNSRGWFRRNGGNWNGDVSANPSTNVGGIDISALFPGNAAFLVRVSNQSGFSHTLNVGGSAFAYSVPSGYTAGWPA